jgi:hypothetical protein
MKKVKMITVHYNARNSCSGFVIHLENEVVDFPENGQHLL